jgi:uncharacterized membrane protein
MTMSIEAVERNELLDAAMLGVLAGMRSMTAPMIVSHLLSELPEPPNLPFPLSLLSEEWVAAGLKLAAVGEISADKAPFMPSRLAALPLSGRVGMGAVSAAAWAWSQEKSPVVAGVIGGVMSLLASLLFYSVRRGAGEKTNLPDAIFALTEDALVAGGAWWFTKNEGFE